MIKEFADYPELLSKKVLVTGGSRGIGRAMVNAFSENGCKVVFLYEKNSASAENTEMESGALAIRCDVSDPEAVHSAVEKAAEIMGGIDILVNNAAVSKIGLFTDMSDDEWAHMMGVNLSGVFYATRAAAKYMVGQQSGRIINIGSMWGKTGASCEVAYSATKAGIRGFTMSLAKELGPSGITVNCIEPGVIETEMNAALSEDTLESLIDETPLCRMGDVADVANLALFLASNGASFITGQNIGVDGGYAI